MFSLSFKRRWFPEVEVESGSSFRGSILIVRASEPLGSEGLWELRSVPGGSESLDSKIVKSVSMTSRDL